MSNCIWGWHLASDPSDESVISTKDKGWYSRGYLPRFEKAGLIQSITFHLADSLPQEILRRWADELAHLSEKARLTERARRLGEWLDKGHGSCCLKVPAYAAIVENALFHFDGERYRLLAWCIMPNHVHVLVETMLGHPLSKIVHSWKSYSAHEINKSLQLTSSLWMRESHDRYIRDINHLLTVIQYIEENPVKANLCAISDEWLWSSARRGFDRTLLVEKMGMSTRR